MTDSPIEQQLRKTMLGQLIAEIAKFGGDDKDHASQLATILLPYIDTYAARRADEAKKYEFNLGALGIIGHYKQWLAMGLTTMQMAAKFDEIEPNIRAALNHKEPNDG